MKKKYVLAAACSLAIATGFAQTKTVTLDYYFNHEFKKAANGEMARFHYMWEDTAQSGFSKLGSVFTKNGFKLKTLEIAPTASNLKGTSVYLIVDPDTDKETAKPNYIQPEDIKAIETFVKKGGIVLMLANDSLNVEFEHFNHLTEAFGIHLNKDIKSRVKGDEFEMAAFYTPKHDKIFKTAKHVYLKEVTSLSLSKTAKPILVHQTEKYVVAAAAKVGKGMVVVVGDPWFYNEYLNGRLGENTGWDNDKAADDLVKWFGKLAK
ncbi:DUF4350 domain-containing protein [Parasediminibacterium sp. JCM 36343]|uniref:DUF4350 domain-containing protein n=1 Tax=Parasediminibacterium sp. JCM 36343 TaxID=3374279 RepID=UPI00397D8D7B